MSIRPSVAATTLLLLAAGAPHALAQKSRVQPVMMTIGEGSVLRDHLGNTYADYRTKLNPDTCVEVTADQVFVRFNRHYPNSSTSDFQYCEKAAEGAFYEQKRQFWLEVANGAACNEFGPVAMTPDLDPLHVRQPFAYWVVDGTTCRVNGHDKPRVRAADAFKAKIGTRTPVVFLILSYDSTVAYEVRATALVQGDSTTRILSNTGTVTLVRNSGQLGVPDTEIATFAMPFHLTFTKVTAAP